MDLQVRIRDIGEGKSLKYQGKIPYENMEDILTATGNQPLGALFRLQISRQGRFFFVKGVVEGEMIFNCDRCLEPYRYFQNETLELTLSPAESDKELSGDIMLSGEEPDVGIYQSECLDLQKIVEEQILLGLPMKRVCSDDCRGICPQCGNNLNTRTCVCPPPDNAHHPFSCLIR